jgi:hypothetical protein
MGDKWVDDLKSFMTSWKKPYLTLGETRAARQAACWSSRTMLRTNCLTVSTTTLFLPMELAPALIVVLREPYRIDEDGNKHVRFSDRAAKFTRHKRLIRRSPVGRAR